MVLPIVVQTFVLPQPYTIITDPAISTFEILPAEVFHKILNHLDTSEIFHSLYNVCRRVNAFLISYNRYELDFSSISRSDFDIVCNIIRPKNITSLILSDDDQTPGQIGLFLSLIDSQELNRLRSLTLLQVEARHLIVFLQHVSVQNLISLTVKWRGGSRCRNNVTQILTLLSSAISQPNLQYLDLSLWIYEIKNLSWPTSCALQYLRIDGCSFSEYCLILRQSPHLKTFVLSNCLMYDIDDTFSSSSFIRPSYQQLLSLTLENIGNIRMKMLKSFLSVTPSLIYLKLVGSGHLREKAFDGTRWKHFIRQHLCLLDKFEFFFTTQRNSNQRIDDVSPLIASFSDKFWMKKKRWFVTCDFIKSFSQIRLYSIPICQSYFEYVSESNLISHSTLITTDNDVDIMNAVRMMSVNLSITDTEPEDRTMNSLVFHQVTELKLEMDGRWPIDSLHFFSTIFDLFHLVKISLNIWFDNDFAPYTINELNNLFERTPNVHTLDNHNRTASAEMICAIVHRHFKYLQVRINCINDMKMILERLQHLSSITFHFPICSSNYPTEIIKWLKQRRTSFTFWCNSYCTHLWFDNNISRN